VRCGVMRKHAAPPARCFLDVAGTKDAVAGFLEGLHFLVAEPEVEKEREDGHDERENGDRVGLAESHHAEVDDVDAQLGPAGSTARGYGGVSESAVLAGQRTVR